MTKLLTFKQKQNQDNLNKLNQNTKRTMVEKPIVFGIFSYANLCKPVTPLGPTLGQFNVNLIEFCKQFNFETQSYSDGLYLTVKIIKKLKAKEYFFKLQKPTIKILLECLLANYLQTDELEKLENLNFINIEIIYDLILLYSYFNNSLDLKLSANCIFSYLKTHVFITKLIIE